jgi:predicted ABC-type transport system involved in lysophospholipase L1 biosynthesis ATPase subunit
VGGRVDTLVKNEQWDIAWRDRQGKMQTLVFELGLGLRYRVVLREERDKERFFQAFLRPPETALLVSDGGLLGNIKVDENLLLPLNYRGVDTAQLESRVVELFGLCGLDEAQTQLLLGRLPQQLSPYQKRVVGFVRSVLLQPKVMVYASIWHGVSLAEIQQITNFDGIFRRYVPAGTGVFVDYDTHLDNTLHTHQTFFL